VAHRRLTNQLHRLSQALPADEEIAAAMIAGNRFGDIGEKSEDDLAQHLVLFEKLVSVEALRVSKRAELHCFGNHWRLCIDVALGPLEIAGNSFDEQRHVIEQLVGRKYAFGRDRHASGDTAQPTSHQLLLRRAQAVGEDRG